MSAQSSRRSLGIRVGGLMIMVGAATWLAGLPEGWADDTAARAEPPSTQPATTQPAVLPMDPDLLAAREHLVSGLVGSKHDFRKLNEEVRDLCLPCHTPHLSRTPVPVLDQRPTTTQPLRPYKSLDQELTGWSLLCLGCHDGVTASDVYTSSHAVKVSDQLAGSQLGTTGLRSHPLGIVYPVASDDYNSRAYVESHGLLLPDGRIQCTTCHDAHNTYRHDGMLKISNSRSRLCLTCHRR